MVNNDIDWSSDDSRASEDCGDLQGDLYIGFFGDEICVKNNNTLRIGFQNVEGLPTLPGKLKEDNIWSRIKKWGFDIFGIAEINLDCRVLNEQERFPHRTKEWWEHQHVSWAHNRNLPPRQARQYGGTALFSVNKAVHRVIGKGQDQSNLGCWSWTRYKGKGNHTFWIFVAYRPNPPQGPFTVYAQHNSFFHTHARDICPQKAFLVDLCSEISSAMEIGDHVVLLIDGNWNMKDSDLSKALQQLSLQEIILSKHGREGPATSKCNSTSTPIDGIWMSLGLGYDKCGCFAYDEVAPSDHRCLWVDLSFINAFGHNMPCEHTAHKCS
jgi:hypothetical protein